MQAYNQEYTNEQYKILKALYKLKTSTPNYFSKHFGDITYERSFKILVENNLIKINSYNNSETGTHYELTILGTNTYFILHQEKVKYWKELAISKWSDVIVAFITAAITSSNWPEISTFIENLLAKCFH